MAVTVETSPFAIQANSYSAEQTRRAIYDLLQRGASVGSVVGGLIGFNPGSSVPDLQVTYSGSGLTVNIAAGQCIVPGSTSTTQSGYDLRVTTSGSLTPASADPSNPRIDLIYAQVQDAAYSGGSNLGTVGISTGTPTSGATLTNLSGAPAVPTSAIAIAYVQIPAGATTISNTNILNEYPMVYFGPNIFNARPISGTATVNAKSGDHCIVSSGSTPITLPSPFKNARVKVTNYGTGVATVSHNSSDVIYGLGMTTSGVSSFLLGIPGATATLESDGTNWFVSAGEQKSGWVNVVGGVGYQNSWTTAVAQQAASFRIDGNRVTLRGGISGGASASTAFTLPSGYRPAATDQYGGYTSTITGGSMVIVTSAGLVQPQESGSVADTWLGGITFLVD